MSHHVPGRWSAEFLARWLGISGEETLGGDKISV